MYTKQFDIQTFRELLIHIYMALELEDAGMNSEHCNSEWIQEGLSGTFCTIVVVVHNFDHSQDNN